MKKRLLALLLCALMLMSLAACGGSGDNTTDQQDTALGNTNGSDSQDYSDEDTGPDDSSVDTPDNPDDNNEDEGGIEVEKNLFDVELTIPSDFIGEDATQESLDAGIADNNGIKSVVLNDDGSATYTMTKAAHAEMLDGIKEGIEEGLAEMVSDTDYTFTEIEHNDDFTKFTVKTDAEELGMSDSFSVLAFYMYGGMYAAFAGNAINNIQVDFINSATGEIIDTANSSEMSE